ncbi:MAG: inositol monophosphatase family protein [Pseudomonadota bacterium]
MTDYSSLLTLAKQAARSAGELLAERGLETQGVLSNAGRDIKLAADRAAEAAILDILKSGSDIPILAEESGHHSGAEDGHLWVVDPLDGSANYNREIPLCAVSIGLLRGDEPILGAIYDFNANGTYLGGEGIPATLNGQAISVSDVSAKDKAVLATGLPVQGDFSPEGLGKMAAGFADWKKVRMLGTSTMASAYVAAGRLDRYAESGTRLWDVAAGMAIVRAAGGRAVLGDGPIDGSRPILIDNGCLPL